MNATDQPIPTAYILNRLDEAHGYLASPHTVYRAAWAAVAGHARDALDRAGTPHAMDRGEYDELFARVKRLRVAEGAEGVTE
jgi:hypothetical protein